MHAPIGFTGRTGPPIGQLRRSGPTGRRLGRSGEFAAAMQDEVDAGRAGFQPAGSPIARVREPHAPRA
jgi:hypothetical protein